MKDQETLGGLSWGGEWPVKSRSPEPEFLSVSSNASRILIKGLL